MIHNSLKLIIDKITLVIQPWTEVKLNNSDTYIYIYTYITYKRACEYAIPARVSDRLRSKINSCMEHNDVN
jgi:hypothetical protein